MRKYSTSALNFGALLAYSCASWKKNLRDDIKKIIILTVSIITNLSIISIAVFAFITTAY